MRSNHCAMCLAARGPRLFFADPRSRVLRDTGPGTDKTRVPPEGVAKGDRGRVRALIPCRTARGGTTKGRSGVPWAEKWPEIRSCRSVAILTLLEVIGGGQRVRICDDDRARGHKLAGLRMISTLTSV